MENHIMFKGQKIDLTPEQAKRLEQSCNLGKLKLSQIEVGSTFKIADWEFIVLEQSGDTTAVILKNLLYENEKFGNTNNYNGSNVDKLCNEFAEKLGKVIGKKNFVPHHVDLTSNDGLKDYGKVKRSASLLTCELYRRYVYILDKYNPKKWWWLSTAYSTPAHNDSSWVEAVTPRGDVDYGGFYYSYIGVRPFCILDSNIFVSR